MMDKEKLIKKVQDIESYFVREVDYYQRNAQVSRPQFCNYYMDLADHYEMAVNFCKQFYETKDIVKLISNLKDQGFYVESNILTQAVEDCD